MFPEWQLQALREAAHRTEHEFILVGFERPVLPESSGNDVLGCSRIFVKWFFDKCIPALESKYPHLKIDTNNISICAESAGALVALDWLHLDKTFVQMYLRYPLVTEYRREPIDFEYRQTPVAMSFVRHKTVKMLRSLAWLDKEVPLAISRIPFDAVAGSMFTGPCLSKCGIFTPIWDTNYPLNMLQQSDVTKKETAIKIAHGTADELVPYASSVTIVNLLRKVGFSASLETWEGAGHGVDYKLKADDPKMAMLQRFLQETVWR